MSLHETFRLLPKPSDHLRALLGGDGLTPDEILDRLPYEASRTQTGKGRPDPRRYRARKELLETCGLLFEHNGTVHLTEFGQATRRWLDLVNPANAPVLGAHAAYALAACQLRNPTRAGRAYDSTVEVFPFSFIWRAILALDGRITSDELNRTILRVTNVDELSEAIDAIGHARRTGAVRDLGQPVATGNRANDRVVPWIARASFGYTLIADKTADPQRESYAVRTEARPILERAARLNFEHREFASVPEYVTYVSGMAGLPPEIAT